MHISDPHLPSIPEDLLVALEERYPDKFPDVLGTAREVLTHRQGELAVIKMLRMHFDHQRQEDRLYGHR